MRKLILLVGVLVLGAVVAFAQDDDSSEDMDMVEMMDDGMITVQSEKGFDETVAALQAAIEEAGFRIPAVIDHSANAGSVDLDLPPTTLIIFGNPNVGTGLMQAERSLGLDLPQKFLVWEDMDGAVFITYNDPVFIAERHGLMEIDETIERISGALANFAAAGAAPADA